MVNSLMDGLALVLSWHMLALTDTQLGMITIATTAIMPDERGRWLQRMDQELEPPPRPVTRPARCRRQRSCARC